MLFADGFGALGVLALWIFCFVDVLLTPEPMCRNLPKIAWVLLVLLFSILGSVAWLVAGRPWDRATPTASTRSSSRWSDAPGTSGARTAQTAQRTSARASNPDDDEEFLAGLRARADEQRRRARERSVDPHNPEDPDSSR